MNIAFFDFDGTITNKDSLAHFIKFAVGVPRYYLGLIILSPMLIIYILKFLDNQQAKEKLISHYFLNWSAGKFQEIANRYSNAEIDNIIRPKALEKIKWHQEQGHKVVLVSASIEGWLQAWCDKNNIQLLATKLELVNGKLTGKFSTPNCYGQEKVNRIKKVFNLNEYENIYAYGDSTGDIQMLNISNFKFMKPFRS
ncbi:MAG: HAD-IB family hydrolase [Hyphomicrobiales bacterium]|nr:MAG: HAD-IB family hydrolase [Hyphomicrobiales bacterium]